MTLVSINLVSDRAIIVSRNIVRTVAILCTRHQPLLCGLSFSPEFGLCGTGALLVNEGDQGAANNHCNDEENQVHWSWVIVEEFVSKSIKGGLRKVEEAGKADDESVDLAEGCEAKDFRRVVTTNALAPLYTC